MVVEVELHTGRIGFHGEGVGYHAVGQFGGECLHPEGTGRPYHLQHEGTHKAVGGFIGQQGIGGGAESYGKPVERHVPHGFAPTGLVIFHLAGFNAGIGEVGHESGHAGGIPTAVVADVDAAFIQMFHHPGTVFGHADESQAGSELHVGEHLLHGSLHAHAVLDEHHQRVGLEQGWQQGREQVLVDRLQAHEHHIAGRHVGRPTIGIDRRQCETPGHGVYLQTVGRHLFVVAVQQKMHVFAGPGQLGTIVSADGACSNDSVKHNIRDPTDPPSPLKGGLHSCEQVDGKAPL